MAGGSSVFFRQHDGDDALGDGWVGRIGGMRGQRGVEIIDLEKDRAAIGYERAKVVFFVWIVGMAKVVVDFDGLGRCARQLRVRAQRRRIVMTAWPWLKFFRSCVVESL